MKKTCAYVVVLVSLILLGVILARLFPLEQKDTSSPPDHAALFASLLPDLVDVPVDAPAELALPFANGVSSAPAISPPPSMIPQSLGVPAEELSVLVVAAPVRATPPSPVPVAPVSYIYFYTGVPVQPVRQTTVAYTPVTIIPAPAVQSYAVPVFTPQVAPSRIGAPRLVYSNGVVIKPKVYFPNQPFRNTLRAVTP